MDKVFKEETERKINDFSVTWSGLGELDNEVRRSLDDNGNPVYVAFFYGWNPKYPKDIDFDEHLQKAMIALLQHDVMKFRNMRDSLSPKYKQMAENIRKAELSKYDF